MYTKSTHLQYTGCYTRFASWLKNFESRPLNGVPFLLPRPWICMKLINRYLLMLTGMTGLVSCINEVRPAFEEMDHTELASYNASSSLDEQIICREVVDGWRIFSGAVSFREEIKDAPRVPGGRQQFQWARYRQQPKFCRSVSQLKALKRNIDFGFQGGGYNGGGCCFGQPADAADYPSTFNSQ